MNLIDLHTHTVLSSHAYSTLQENVLIAKEKQLKYYGVSDHTHGLPGGQHIYGLNNLRVIPDFIYGVRVLKGAEINIVDGSGNIDISMSDLNDIDYAIASLHGPAYQDEIDSTVITNAYINVVKLDKVKILGHIDDGRYPFDLKKVVEACVLNNTVIEINNSSLNPQGFRVDANVNVPKILKECALQNCPIIMNSDAHISFDVGNIERSIKMVKEAGFPENLIVNYNENLIEKYILGK